MNHRMKGMVAIGLTAGVLSSMLVTAGAAQEDTLYNQMIVQQEETGDIYTAMFTGRWDNQQVDGFEGNYSVYVPSNFEYCSPGVILLTPDGVTAADWLDSALGAAWQEIADANGIALVVAEPQGGNWNLTQQASQRDDEAYLYGIYGKLTSKADANPSVFDLNERALYMVGYGEGGTAANQMAMLWPALFAGVVSVGGEAVSADVANALGDAISYPFAESTTEGREENNLPNREIPVRTWQIEIGENSLEDTVDYWLEVNGLSAASTETTNDYATVVTNLDEDGSEEPEQVWYSSAASEDTVAPTVIYGEFLQNVQRFVGDPGGYLEWTVQHTNDGIHGFFLSEEKMDGHTRRWYTYVPASYDGTQDVPLVVAMHGYSSAISAFTGDSRWQNVADEYGFIVVFAQAYVGDGAYSEESCIPVPIWNNDSPVYLNSSDNSPDDVAFIKYLVDTTKENYSVDASRVYATGHSNGSGMSWKLAQDAPEYFTAVAPIGLNWGSYPGYAADSGTVDFSGCDENEYLLPVWCMTGEFDLGEADDYSADNRNGKTVSYWKAMNGTNNVGTKTTEIRATRSPHTYSTTTYSGENGAPLVRFTQISNNCHSYMEDIAFMVWEEFFSQYSRGEDGTLYYNGQAVKKTDGSLAETFTDVSGHWAETAIDTAVDELGLFAGTDEGAFSPDDTMTRAMFMAVLYRMDINAQASSCDSGFTDVPENAYYANAVTWAAENGIASGASATTFEPNSAVTREQIVTLLYNYAKHQGMDISVSASLDSFTDAASVSAYAEDAMQWAVGAQVMNGRTATTLEPQGIATRAEVAQLLVNFNSLA